MTIPFADVRASYAAIGTEVQAELADIFATGQFVQGRRVARLEEAFAEYTQSRFAVAVASGTDALEISLRGLRVAPGDEVITTPLTFFATAEALCAVGATPVFVDVDPRTLQLDVDAVAAAVTERTVGVVPVHLYGAPVPMESLVELALEHELWILEDAAQAHGARYLDRPVGSMGTAGCFSFYPGKNLGTCGEGGMIVTQERALAERLRMLRDHGSFEKYHHRLVGKNARMSEIEACVLGLKLPHLEGWNEARRRVAGWYAEGLAGLPLELPTVVSGGLAVHHLYVVRTPERDALRAYLGEHDVQTGLHYPVPLHRQEALRGVVPAGASFPHAERAAASVLSLPMFPELEREQVAEVCARVHTFFDARRTALAGAECGAAR